MRCSFSCKFTPCSRRMSSADSKMILFRVHLDGRGDLVVELRAQAIVVGAVKFFDMEHQLIEVERVVVLLAQLQLPRADRESTPSSTCSSWLKSTSVPLSLSRCISLTSAVREICPTRRGTVRPQCGHGSCTSPPSIKSPVR